MAESLEDSVGLAEPARLQPGELLLHRGLVLRQVAGEPRHLGADQGSDAADDGQRQQHGDDDGWHAPKLDPAQQVDDGGEDEAEEHCQHEGDEDLAAEVEGGNEHDTDGEGQEAA
ncbi:hypothetical protein AEGHOMDF_2756 [Methylobacterium soli]|nr:hypothetical protein AEGHOMDF_2756 [Methylobacterium soli]